MGQAMNAACREGDVDEVRQLLDKATSVNCVDFDDCMTPIMKALEHRHMDVVRLLHGRGADVTMVDEDDWNVLHYAAYGGHRESINWVLANTSIAVNATTINGCTSVSIAITNNGLDASKLLIEKGANPFMKVNLPSGECAMNKPLGPQVLQHAKDLIWVSVKPLLLLS
jgi:ankyrin repeat protein